MKPIKLSVSGLHSFREKQEIDFETLCQGGIFGIFGPTGSGKSSLLDAMTLALYGKVERAANNTQGIMNHAEDTLSVSFTFELGANLRYRVERSYKRSGDISIRSANSRLVELGDENTVLADKDRDVSQKIQEILGLTIDDFTRAVVLPQGKFAEFLSLKGTERRQMLQRLFQLEKYGDQFNRRLRARVDEQKYFLNEVIAEQTGLGEASKENLREAKSALQKAERAAEAARESLMEAEKRKEEATEIWELKKQITELNKKKDELQNKSDEIEVLQTKINKATAASQLKPYLDAVEATEEEAIKAHERYEETKRRLKEANTIYLAKLEAYEKHRSNQQEQEPLLIKRLNELERGMGLEKDLSKLRSEWNSLEEQRIALEKETSSTDTETEKAQQDLKVARSLQTDLNQQLTELQVAPTDRKRMSRALSLKQEFQSLKKQLEETAAEEKKQAADRDRLRPFQVETTHKLNKAKENYSTYYHAVLSIYHKVSSYKLTLEKQIVKLQDQIEDANQKLEESRTHAIAIRLAQNLNEGESCPVCGSKEHVQLAEGEDHTGGWQDQIRRDEQVRETLNEQFQNAKQLQYKLEQLSDLMTEEDECLNTDKENSLPKVSSKLSNDELVTEMKSLAQDVKGLEAKIKQEGKLLQENRSKATEYAYRLEQVEEYLKERQEKQRDLGKQIAELERLLLR